MQRSLCRKAAMMAEATFAFALLAMGALPATAGEGPVGLWHFDEAGGDVLTDSIGANHGNLAPGEDAPFRISGALSFDGVKSYAKLPASPIFDFNKAWTVSAWIFPRKRPAEKAAIVTMRSAWYFQMTNSGLLCAGQYRWLDADETSRSYVELSSDDLVPLGKWRHVAATSDGETLSLYIDGRASGQMKFPGTALVQAGEPSLGKEPGFGRAFCGLIDELFVHRRALSSQEIAELASSHQPVVINLTDISETRLDLPRRPMRPVGEARPGNRVDNASFECGPYAWFDGGDVSKAPAVSESEAKHGGHALHLTNPVVGVTSHYFFLDDSLPHTVSLWAKGAEGARLGVTLYSSYAHGRGDMHGEVLEIMSDVFPLTGDWQRFSLSGQLPYCPNGYFRLAISANGGEAFVDGVQVEEGPMRPFAPAAPAEVGVRIENAPTHRILRPGDTIEANWEAFVAEGAGDVEAAWKVMDYDDEVVEEGDLDVGEGHSSGRITFTAGDIGVFRVMTTAHAAPMRCSFEAEDIFGVVKTPDTSQVPVSESRFGTHIEHTKRGDGSFDTRYVEIARLMGIRWNRMHDCGGESTQWPFVQREKGEYRLLADEATFFKQQGFELLGLLEKTPGWASPDGHATSAPRDIADWEAYVEKTVTFFKPYIHSWEIWNEPFTGSFWTSPYREYTPLLESAWRVIKRVDPEAEVVGVCAGHSIQYGGNGQFMNDVFDAGASGHFDVLSFHCPMPGYSFDTPMMPNEYAALPWRKAIADFRDFMDRYGDPKPMQNTEAAMFSRSFWRGHPQVTDNASARYFPPVDYREAVNYNVRSHVVSFAGGVERFFFYYMAQDGTGIDDIHRQAMIASDGMPKPFVFAYPVMIDLLDGRDFIETAALGERTYAYVFEGRGETVAVVWTLFAKDPDTGTLTMTTSGRGRVVSVMGKTITEFDQSNALTAPIGREPRYLVFSADASSVLAAMKSAAVHAPPRFVKQPARPPALDRLPGY